MVTVVEKYLNHREDPELDDRRGEVGRDTGVRSSYDDNGINVGAVNSQGSSVTGGRWRC